MRMRTKTSGQRVKLLSKQQKFIRLSAALVILGSCSSSTNDEVIADTTSVSADSTTPTVEANPVGTQRWLIAGTYRTGETISIEVELGEPRKIAEIQPFDVRDRIVACTVDQNRDAVMPIRVTVKNTTEGFPIQPEFGLNVADSTGEFAADQYYGVAGSDCLDGRLFGMKWNDPLTFEQNPIVASQYVIIRNLFSPNQPNGDQSLVSGTLLDPTFKFDGTYKVLYGETSQFNGRTMLKMVSPNTASTTPVSADPATDRTFRFRYRSKTGWGFQFEGSVPAPRLKLVKDVGTSPPGKARISTVVEYLGDPTISIESLDAGRQTPEFGFTMHLVNASITGQASNQEQVVLIQRTSTGEIRIIPRKLSPDVNELDEAEVDRILANFDPEATIIKLLLPLDIPVQGSAFGRCSVALLPNTELMFEKSDISDAGKSFPPEGCDLSK
jgi:hypothetical protein